MTTPQNRNENLHATAAQNHSGMEEGERTIEATLALAYEQRTANLIALWSNPESSSGDVIWGVGEERIGRILQEIQERLGFAE
jgi:hypothetical protein